MLFKPDDPTLTGTLDTTASIEIDGQTYAGYRGCLRSSGRSTRRRGALRPHRLRQSRQARHRALPGPRGSRSWAIRGRCWMRRRATLRSSTRNEFQQRLRQEEREASRTTLGTYLKYWPILNVGIKFGHRLSPAQGDQTVRPRGPSPGGGRGSVVLPRSAVTGSRPEASSIAARSSGTSKGLDRNGAPSSSSSRRKESWLEKPDMYRTLASGRRARRVLAASRPPSPGRTRSQRIRSTRPGAKPGHPGPPWRWRPPAT